MTRHSLLLGTYGKPKFSSLYTNYNSCIPSEYKTGLVATTLDWCFQITSSHEIVQKDIKRLPTIMTKNAYPRPFLVSKLMWHG